MKPMISNKNSAHDRGVLLETSVTSLFMGLFTIAICPSMAVMGGVCAILGYGGMCHYVLSRNKFEKLWENLKLGMGTAYPKLKSTTKKETSKIYKFRLPIGMCSEDFEKKKLAIEQFLGRTISIKYTYKELWIEVFEETLIKTREYEIYDCKGEVSFPVGFNREGTLIYCNLSNGEPHLLIAGETGSGKSTALRAIITNLLLTKDIELYLIDLKRGAEFNIFSKCGKVKSFARTKNEAADVLHRLSNEIDRRYDLLFSKDCVDIREYNRKYSKNKLNYEVAIIDEFADLMHEKESIRLLEELSSKARACGIHLILSTQRPDMNVLNGRIKANITTVLGLKTMNDINSRIIIGKDGLEKLNGKGHGIFKRGYECEIQVPNLSSEKARDLLKPIYIEDKTVKNKTLVNGSLDNFDFLDVIVQ